MLSFKGDLEVVVEDSSRIGKDDLLNIIHVCDSSWIHGVR